MIIGRLIAIHQDQKFLQSLNATVGNGLEPSFVFILMREMKRTFRVFHLR